jgi:hypothetical protein
MAIGGPLRTTLLIFVADQIKAFALMLAVLVADRATAGSSDRRGAYVLAVLIGGAAGAAAGATFASWVGSGFTLPRHLTLGLILYIYLDLVLIGGAALWVMNDRRGAALARERMHRAEIERVEAAKRSVEADLQTMQARVDPRFLFDTLEEVKRLYAADAVVGERMLDELIAYLRAAMPKMRAKSSTVGQEAELARSYLAIWRIELGERLSFRVDVPDDMAEVPMPPMIVLPLIHHAIAARRADERGSRSLDIRASRPDGRVEVEISDSAQGLLPNADDSAITAVRERLAALFGDEAVLTFDASGPAGSLAVIDLPGR